MDYIDIHKSETISESAGVALDVEVALDGWGIGVFFSATAWASAGGYASGSYGIEFGIRVTNNHDLAFDPLILGGGITEFRPSLLPNGALVDGLANATARFASSITGPYQSGSAVDENGNPPPALDVAAHACVTQGLECRTALPER